MEFCELFPNLASTQLGTEILFATDEWFAAAENVIKDEAPHWDPNTFTPFGKEMDGWESRRRRTEGYDWCIIELGLPGVIKAIEIDTLYFTGNFSPKASVFGGNLSKKSTDTVEKLKRIRAETAAARPEFGRQGLAASEEEMALVAALESETWAELVPLSPLGAGYEGTSKTVFTVSAGVGSMTHVRLNMGPDGGIARIRVHGEVSLKPDSIPIGQEFDLAAVEVGGLALAFSNQHYGHPRNLIVPGRGHRMDDGWETARQPNRPAVYEKGADGLMVLPGCDWAVLQLGFTGTISSIEVDTNFYKGNYPESCLIEACYLTPQQLQAVKAGGEGKPPGERYAMLGPEGGGGAESLGVKWSTLLPRTRLTPNAVHAFSVAAGQLYSGAGPATLMRMTIYPDGGVMRVRVIGKRYQESKL